MDRSSAAHLYWWFQSTPSFEGDFAFGKRIQQTYVCGGFNPHPLLKVTSQMPDTYEYIEKYLFQSTPSFEGDFATMIPNISCSTTMFQSTPSFEGNFASTVPIHIVRRSHCFNPHPLLRVTSPDPTRRSTPTQIGFNPHPLLRVASPGNSRPRSPSLRRFNPHPLLKVTSHAFVAPT